MEFHLSEARLLFLADDGRFPNSPYPVLIYVNRSTDRCEAKPEMVASALEETFAGCGWPPDWRDGIYDYHHYHSTAHEALGIAAGHAKLMLGGERGELLEVTAGDVLVLPAGTGHCAIAKSADFLVVGAYPKGQKWDVMRGERAERPAAMQRIAAVPIPSRTPLGGDLRSLWV